MSSIVAAGSVSDFFVDMVEDAMKARRLEASQAATIFTFLFVISTVPMIALYVARAYKNGVGRAVYHVDPASTYWYLHAVPELLARLRHSPDVYGRCRTGRSGYATRLPDAA